WVVRSPRPLRRSQLESRRGAEHVSNRIAERAEVLALDPSHSELVRRLDRDRLAAAHVPANVVVPGLELGVPQPRLDRGAKLRQDSRPIVRAGVRELPERDHHHQLGWSVLRESRGPRDALARRGARDDSSEPSAENTAPPMERQPDEPLTFAIT